MEKDRKEPVFVANSSNPQVGSELILWKNGEPVSGVKNGKEFDYQNAKVVP